jgi:hypothetical protein
VGHNSPRIARQALLQLPSKGSVIKHDLLAVKGNPTATQSFTLGVIMQCSHAIHYGVRVDNWARHFVAV